MNILHICAILCTIGAAVAQDYVKTQCMKESGATREELRNFFQNGLKEEDFTDAIKSHIKCAYIKKGFLKDGKIQGEAVMQFLTTELVDKNFIGDIIKALNECKAETGADDTETVYNFINCIKRHQAIVILHKKLGQTF